MRKLYLIVLLGLMMGPIVGWGQVTLATFNFESSTLSPSVGAIGSPALTGSATVSYFGGSTTSPTASACFATANLKFFEVTIATTGYTSITVDWNARTSGTVSSWVVTADDGGGYGGTLATQTLGTTFAAAPTLSLATSFNNKVQIKVRWTANVSATQTIRIDDIVIRGMAAPSCTAPTTQASALTFSGISPTQQTLNFTRGNGNGGVLVIGRAGSAPTDPASGTAYTGNLVFGSGDAVGGGRAVYNAAAAGASTATAQTVTGLAAQTRYYYNLYEWNTTSTCYNLTELAGDAWTLSDEPAAHAASLSATAASSAQINLAFSAASNITNADGYVILRRADNTVPSTLGVADGVAPGSWSLPPGTVPVTTIASTAVTTFSNTGLTASTDYCYLLIPYNWDGTNAATYNYRTAGVVADACATTFAPPAPTITSSLTRSTVYGTADSYTITAANSPTSFNATGLPAGLSIVTSTGVISGTPSANTGSYNVTITATNGSGTDTRTLVWTIAARPLTITGLSASNKIYDGTTAAVLTGTATLNNVVFSDDVTIAGTPSAVFNNKNVGNAKPVTITGYTISGTKAGNYSVTQPTGVTANITPKSVTVTGAVAQNKPYNGTTAATITGATLVGVVSPDVVTVSGGGTFASENVGTGIVVTASLSLGGADAGNYSLTQPIGLSANITAIAPTVTTSPIGITVGGSYTLAGANVSSNSAGAFSYSLGTASPAGSVTLTGSTLNGVAVGTATLTVNQLASGNYTAGSATVTVNVSTITYVDGDFMTDIGGTWNINGTGTATWLKRISGTFQSTAEIPNGTPGSYTVYITQNVTVPVTGSSGSFATAKLYVTNNAKFTYDWTSTQNTFRNIVIDNGATIEMNGRFTVLSTGEFEIKDGGTFIYAYTPNASSTLTGSFWNGIEKFAPNSNFRVTNHTTGSGNYFLPPAANLTANIYNGVTAYFGNLYIESAGEVRMTTTNLSSPTTFLTHSNLEFKNNTASNYNLFYGSGTWVVGKDFVFNAGSLGDLTVTTGANTINLNVKGDFKNNSGRVFRLGNNPGAIVTTLNIDGNLSMTAGSLDLGFTSGGTGTVNLKGDVDIAAGAAMYAASGTTSSFNFTGTGDGSSAATTQTVSIASTAANRNQNIAFICSNVNTGSYVQLSNQDFELGQNSTLTVQASCTLDFGFNGSTPLNVKIVSGAGNTTFAAAQRSTLKITSPEGLYQNWDSYTGAGVTVNTGNVQGVPKSSRSISPIATFWFNGKSNQVTGDCVNATLSTNADAKVVICDLATNGLTLTPTVSFGVTSSTTVSPTGGKLDIRSGQFTETISAYIFNSTGTLYMAANTLYFVAKGSIDAATAYSNAEQIPRMAGSSSFPYILNGGTIELGGNSVNNYFQVLRADDASYNYFNVKYSGSNTLNTDYKAMSDATNINNSLIITGTAVVDCKTSAGIAAPFLGNAGIVMDGGRLRIFDRSGAQPQLTGTASAYNLTGGVIEFYATGGGSSQTIRGLDGNSAPIAYNQIEVTGTDVANSNSNITLRQNGIFTVKSTGAFTINDDAIVGPGTSETVVVENGGVFNCGNTLGFNGPVVGLNSPSVRGGSSSNIETITLNTNSTVVYTKTGDQTITNTTPYQNLTISGTGNKTPVLNGTVTVQGNLSKTGSSTFVHNSSEFLFNNTAAIQTFTNTGTTAFNFYNLTNSNTAGTGLNVNGNLGVVRALTLSPNSKLTLNAGFVNLKSTSAATAFVTEVPNDATITYAGTGRFVVERYFGTRRAWRLMTAPLSVAGGTGGNTFFHSYQAGGNNLSTNSGNGTYISGPGANPVANGLDITPLNNSSLKTYNPVTGLFVNVPDTRNLSISGSTFNPGTPDNFGFFMFVRGDRVDNPNQFTAGLPVNETTLRDTGRLQRSSYNFPGNNLAVGRMALIGNPYPSPVDFEKISRTNISNRVWTWDPNINEVGGYVLFDAAAAPGYNPVSVPNASYTGTIGQSKIIQSKQAFFIETSNTTNPSITIEEADKDINNNQAAYRPASGKNAPMLAANLYGTNTRGEKALLDGNLLQVAPEFSNEVNLEDAVKFTNVNENFGINNQKWLSIERRKLIAPGDTIQYVLSRTSRRKYQLHFIADAIATNDVAAYAEDNFTKTKQPLNMQGDSYYDFEVNANPASAASNRFRVVFKKIVAFNHVDAAVENNDIAISWSVTGELNLKHFEVERSVDGSSFSGIGITLALGDNEATNSYRMLDEKVAPGIYYYRLKTITNNGGVAYSEKVKVVMMNSKSPIYVYPNPVTNGNIGLQFNSQAAGKYAVRLINKLGQVVLNKQLVHSGGTASHLVEYTAAAGSYQLEVTAPGKKAVVLTVQLIQ